MTMCKVSKLFYVKYGVNLELSALTKDENGINFVSRTSKRNGVSAKVKLIPGIEPLPAGSLSVACGGSVMETFLQLSPYYSGRDLYYLVPKVYMSNEVKLFYSLCLRNNKFRFSYGRQANVSLSELLIPDLDSIPDFVRSFSIPLYSKQLLKLIELQSDDDFSCGLDNIVRLDSLFYDIPGIASSQVVRIKEKISENWIPYIRPSYRQETSIDAYVNKDLVESEKIFPLGTLYVSTDGQGSHTYSYVSTFEFVPNSNITVLIPKRSMSIQEKIFYAHCITKNRYKFSYGRKPKGDRLRSILLPEFPPDFVREYNIGNVINSFSDVIEQL